MNNDSNIIESLSQYLRYIENNYGNDFVLFRGQHSDNFLIPRIGRLRLKGELKSEEQKIFKNFKLFSVPFIQVQPLDEWDWIALAQHHGLPTRLLDWTANPLIALWFAVNKPPKINKKGKEENGVVWMFTPQKDHFVGEEDTSPFNINGTRVFQPKHVARRISAQSGWFTVHRYMDKSKKFIKMEQNKRYMNYIEKLVIPPNLFPDLRKSLDKCNINAATVFPDIDGLCSLLQWKYSLLEDEEDIIINSAEYIAATSEDD